MVLGRVASNFVSAERARRMAAKNENTPPGVKARGLRAAFTQKIASSLSSISAASRRRRARLHGGLEKDRQRVNASARRYDAQSRSQSRSRTHTPPVQTHSLVLTPQTSPSAPENSERMETDDCEMVEAAPSVEELTPAFRGVTLPSRLRRPAYREVNKAALAAIDPGLAETNIEYVRDCLEVKGVSMLNVLARTATLSTSTKPTAPCPYTTANSGMPTGATVRVSDTTADLPTHMLGVYSSIGASTPTQPRKTHVQLVPVHSIILAAHCANLGPLPASSPETQINGPKTEKKEVVLNLPVVPLSVPDAGTLPLMMAYLYAQDGDRLLKAVLGVEVFVNNAEEVVTGAKAAPVITVTPPSSTSAPTQLPTPAASPQPVLSSLPPSPRTVSSPSSMSTATSSSAQVLTNRVTLAARTLAFKHAGDGDALLRKARLVLSLWQNAYALGIFDSGLWSMLDVAWAVVLGALAVCQARGHARPRAVV